MTIEDVFEDIDDNVVYYMEEIDYDWTDEMIEGLVEEETEKKVSDESWRYKNIFDYSQYPQSFECPEGYQFVDENGNVINATKIVLEKKKKEYPKTYEECCRVLGVSEFEYNHTGTKMWYRHKLMATLDNLMLCRDVYWKIAGEKMELRKPWKPENPTKHYIFTIETCGDDIIKNAITSKWRNRILVFPTEEMRDAFYENFKELIEMCKEFL